MMNLHNAVRKGEWLEIRLESPPTIPLEQFVTQHCSVPAKLSQRFMRNNGIQLQGDRLRLHLFPQAEDLKFAAEWHDLDILYEDDFCLVVNKPAGLLVHPTESGKSGTLANAVAAYYESTGQACKVSHIHRLDEDTSGPVLFAKNELAHFNLDEQMRSKAIDRRYIAIAQGKFPLVKGTIDRPIGKDRHHSNRRRVSPTGDHAVTHYEVVESFTDAALLLVRLETGRTHQIRVHMQSIGHPLLGDTLYGGKANLIQRQALHGESLVFLHPFTQEVITVSAPWPLDLQELVALLRTDTKNKM